jgi:hypothetical protein
MKAGGFAKKSGGRRYKCKFVDQDIGRKRAIAHVIRQLSVGWP